jgi:hypothetical protein
MHWSHNKVGQWRCAVLGATYQAYRVGDGRWMAEKIDPAGHFTALGAYDTLKNCKVHAGLDYVREKRQEEAEVRPVLMAAEGYAMASTAIAADRQ